MAVWLWAILIAVLVALAAAFGGAKYDVASQLDAFPRIPFTNDTLSTGGVLALVLAALLSLIGAVVGGLGGMRYHRRIDDRTRELGVETR